MISRQNYEIWFLDYHEGLLDSKSAEQLFSFLEQNPDLKLEFDSFEILSLEEQNVKFEHKDKLFKNIDLPHIEGLNEFEILAVKKIENDISPSEEEILNHLTGISPERSKEFRAFKLSRLKPDPGVVYQGKELLKKDTGIFRRIYAYSGAIAAAVVLLLFFFSLIRTPGDEVFDSSNDDLATAKKSSGSAIAGADLMDFPGSNKSFVTPADEKDIISEVGAMAVETKNQAVNTHKQQISDTQAEQVLIAKISTTSVLMPVKTPELRSTESTANAIREQSTYEQTELAFSNTRPASTVLTPREYLIKTVKNRLEIDDDDYSAVNTMELLAASVNKTGLANMDYQHDPSSDSRRFSFNIGSFEVARSW